MNFVTMVFWHWWILSVIFLIAELLIPAFFFLWMAVSAAVTGLLVLLIPAMSPDMQILFFSALSITSIWGWKVYGRKLSTKSDQPFLNKRGSQYVGRVFTLYEPIINGTGKIKVDDTIWKVSGIDCDTNTKVKVISSHGNIFQVEKVD
jgi:membrane protein implicated in regulation of membrane protease activity